MDINNSVDCHGEERGGGGVSINKFKRKGKKSM